MTPVERAAGPLVAAHGEALRDPRIPHVGQHAARAAFESIDAGELAWVIHHQIVEAAQAERIDIEVHSPGINFERTIARALVEHLTKGDENDG